QYQENGFLPNNRTEYLGVIKPILLIVAFINQTSLVPGNTAICIVFNFVHPFTAHWVPPMGLRYKNPSFLISQSLKLVIYSMTLISIF
ncbi:hypothetical protein, partial [Klebsiella pneumoniae]|uniref:hypothetical protein n=1 Tax=Klebsiella pneumoniae TaxID=573 RepID=UPI003A80421D